MKIFFPCGLAFLLWISVFCLSAGLSAQIPFVRGDSLILVEQGLKKLNRNINFTVIPGPVFGATDKLGFVILPMIVYDINKDDTISPPSSTGAMVYLDFQGSWMLGAKQDFYWKQNRWRSFFTAGVGKMQMRFYGIGNATEVIGNEDSLYSWITSGQAWFKVSVYRKVIFDFYAGLEYDFTHSVIESRDSEGARALSSFGIDESQSFRESVLVPTFVWDDRNNIFWSTRGYHAGLNLQFSNKIIGSSTNYSIINGWASGYHMPVRNYPRLTLAWYFYTQLAWGSLPYNRYSIYGRNDHVCGYTSGKYVDRSEFTLQAEVRTDLWKFIGAGCYLGTGQVFPSLDRLKYSVWLHFGGIRGYVNIIPSRNLRLRLDLAFARRDWGFFIGLGQAF